AQVQMDKNAGEHDVLVHADLEPLAAHADEYFLVGLHVLRGEVPVTHGHADLVEREWLRGRAPHGERRREQKTTDQGFHACLPVVPAFCWPAIGLERYHRARMCGS